MALTILYWLKERSYRESVELVLCRVLVSSSNVRSVSLVAATGVLRQFKMREDVNLLLNPREMGELIRTSKHAASSFHKYAPKMGELRHMHLDFEIIQVLIFPMPDHNLLLVTLEKVEPEVPRIVSFITRLLQSEGLIHAS
jgi:hypothetical protein